MSYTYTQDVVAPEAEAAFVPSYARKSAKSKPVKTWMVLTPIGAVALIGGAVAMLMSGGENVQPLVEPEAAPVVVSQPVVPVAATVAAPASVARLSTPRSVAVQTSPVRQVVPASERHIGSTTTANAQPVMRRATPPATPIVPRAYEASTAVVTAPAAVAPAPVTVTPPAPSITVQPLN